MIAEYFFAVSLLKAQLFCHLAAARSKKEAPSLSWYTSSFLSQYTARVLNIGDLGLHRVEHDESLLVGAEVWPPRTLNSKETTINTTTAT